MSYLMQNVLVLLLVGACATYALWGATQTLWGKRSRMGSCCAKGCGAQDKIAKPQASAQRTVFLPVEFLKKKV